MIKLQFQDILTTSVLNIVYKMMQLYLSKFLWHFPVYDLLVKHFAIVAMLVVVKDRISHFLW